MWYEGAIRLPGPAWKVGYTVFGRTSQKTSVVDHSAEGPYTATIGVLNSWRNVSWQFTNDDSGLYQHYPVTDVCWHAGYEANKKCVGVENTGRAGEPLTERQYENLLGLHKWLKEIRILTVCERGVDLFEHNEFMATDCPAGRIPWARLIADLKEEQEEEMKPPLYRIEGRSEVYYAVGGKLFHVKNQATFLALGYKSTEVTVLPAKNVIWNLAVEYSGGIPAPLRS